MGSLFFEVVVSEMVLDRKRLHISFIRSCLLIAVMLEVDASCFCEVS
jgi:hypothetical protein